MNITYPDVVIDVEDDSDAHSLTCQCEDCDANRVLDLIEDRAA